MENILEKILDFFKENSEITNIIYLYLGLVCLLGTIIYKLVRWYYNYKKNKIKYKITAEWRYVIREAYEKSTFDKIFVKDYYYYVSIKNQSLNKNIILDSLIATKPLKRKEYLYYLKIPNINLKYKEYYEVPIQLKDIQNISKKSQSKKFIFYFVDNLSNKKYKKKIKRKNLEEISKMI